jgi:hypothetical protein
MSWKEEYIEKYGEEAYEKQLEQKRQWREANPEKAEEHNHETSRKGGKYYEKRLEYAHTGLQGERNKIRTTHANKWRPYKKIIAPDSQIHHEWIFETADFRGVALVEADQHMHGIIKVIQILKGVITVFTEKEIREEEIGYVIE